MKTMESRTKPQEVDKEETEEDLLYYSDNSEEIDPRDAYREILRKKSTEEFFKKRLLLASYISLKIFTMAIVIIRPTCFG